MELKDKLLEHRNMIIAVIIILGLLGLNIYTLTLIEFESKESNEEVLETPKKEETPSKIKVDLKGEVNAPGIYELNKNDRVDDLINKAGGLTKNADTSIINLSKKLDDEMVVFIYSKAEVKNLKNGKEEKCECPDINDACITNQLEPLTEEKKQTSSKSEATNNKISINKATAEELQSLSGIGKSKAKAIIEHRDKNGQFKTIEEIKNVSGIGEALFEKIKNNITT
ncbi:MAG: helix-hairpin-helix domain-containing protein [Bacilli bacterium]